MIPQEFEYEHPSSVADAIAMLGKHGGEARILAGGHSLVPLMKLRLAAPDALIDIGGIASLRGITDTARRDHDRRAHDATRRWPRRTSSRAAARSWPRPRPGSATRRCETAARSAGRWPTPTRTATCRPCSSRSTAT